MKNTMAQDNFYDDGSEPLPTKTKQRNSRERRTHFDQTKVRTRRAKNRGASRLMRRIRRHEKFRMKIMYFVAGLVLVSILMYAVSEHMKWSRVNKLPPSEQAAAMELLIEKNRNK